MDQLADDVPPGLLDGGLAVPVLDRRWEASRALPAALVFAESGAECESADELDPMLRGWEKSDVDHALGAEWFFDPDEALLPECPEPVSDGAFGNTELFSEPPVPEPACVGAEAVEISEEVFL